VSVEISVVIPAYNEEVRLPPFLLSVVTYLDRVFQNHFEIIVADDGSRDGTFALVNEFSKIHPQVRCIRLPVNRGKGAAVREGVSASVGRLVLYCDADGAAPIEEEVRLRNAVETGADVAVGSRMVSSADVVVERPKSRRWAGKLFVLLARWTLKPPVRDTQCGFKMFKGDVARKIAAAATEDGYLFDLEWLALAQRKGLRITEVAINWKEMPGSKLSMTKDALKVLGALGRLRHRLKEQA
jgi:dolichyl-phosphate beta-glucosyltransferase